MDPNRNTPTPPPRSAFKTEAAYKAAMREYNEMNKNNLKIIRKKVDSC